VVGHGVDSTTPSAHGSADLFSKVCGFSAWPHPAPTYFSKFLDRGAPTCFCGLRLFCPQAADARLEEPQTFESRSAPTAQGVIPHAGKRTRCYRARGRLRGPGEGRLGSPSARSLQPPHRSCRLRGRTARHLIPPPSAARKTEHGRPSPSPSTTRRALHRISECAAPGIRPANPGNMCWR